MRVAIFSDIHGNVTGLRAILSQIGREGKVDKILCAGDMIGGGAGTNDLLELLFEYQVDAIRGNHEEMAIDLEMSKRYLPNGEWKRWAYEYEWLRNEIKPAYWEWMAELPTYRKIKMGEEKYLMVCHATPESAWEKVCAPDVPMKDLERAYGKIEAEVIAYGHYHKNHVIQMGGKILVNVASVGMRKDGMSAYSIVEYADSRWIIEQYQVKYDETEERRLEKEKKFPREGVYR